MDREQQIRLNFLDEAQSYLDQVESILLGLNPDQAEPQQLDLALRCAHSLKGGAGMMGFLTMSQVAHRLEDFLKILRLRYHSGPITTEVETLLLKGVDGLRHIVKLHHQGTEVEESFLNEQIYPVFENLRHHLGDLEDDEENALFDLNQGATEELLLFEEELDKILDEFEQQVNNLSSSDLAAVLIMTSEELMVLSQMADLEAFTKLCQSIEQQTMLTAVEDLDTLAQQALNIWRRSHALVARGSLEKLPSQLIEIDQQPENQSPNLDSSPFVGDSEFASLNWDDMESLNFDLTQVQGELANIDDYCLEQLQAELELLEQQNSEDSDLVTELSESLPPQEKQKIEVHLQSNSLLESVAPVKQGGMVSDQPGKTLRVPVEQLSKFNNLFGKLILERNTVNLHLEQLKNFASLMRQRMLKLEESHNQLRKWYDGSSVEGLIATATEEKILTPTVSNGSYSPANIAPKDIKERDFDILEMDRYSDLHLISQEQIETIVQLQEVTTDMEIGLQEVTQAMGELNQTTRSLQSNVTRTQMTPFADVVKTFPRVIRDLCVQFDKLVKLKIEGESTLIDRSIVETINAPLIHLLRNAFDHGIENPATRIAKGKSPEGTINIKAVNRGNQTIITIEDDGNGISLDKIGDHLVERGKSRQEINQMSEKEILNYIFEPGFSTKDRVTELSGRGVGMDVVLTNIRDIRGDIQIQTKAGIGTTFALKIPFSLSILRVMLLERAGFVFAVPLNSIKEIRSVKPEEIVSITSPDQLTWNDKTIPLVRLEESLTFNRVHKTFLMRGNPIINKSTVLIVGEGTSFGGIYLDRVWGEQEVTIRSIDTPIPLPQGFNSSIVLGDGRVIPLIDPLEMLQGCLESSQKQDDTDNYLVKDINELNYQAQVKTILIVDDSINVRNYLALTLERAGYQVEEAKDGREAVDKLLHGLDVQGVICDIEMPRLDGYGVLEELKGKSEFQDLPIIMLTSRSNDKHRKLAINLGANGYFSKPYNEQELLQKLADSIATNYSMAT